MNTFVFTAYSKSGGWNVETKDN